MIDTPRSRVPRKTRPILQEPHWFRPGRGHSPYPEPQLADWLGEHGSLTRRLQQHCKGMFSVRILHQGWEVPTHEEQCAVGSMQRQRCFVREVYLQCDGRPMVFARTVIPRGTLTGKRKPLLMLGTRPLGAYLFAQPGVERTPIQWACLDQRHDIYRHAVQALKHDIGPLWGRRSVFYLEGQPLLVSEYFLESMHD